MLMKFIIKLFLGMILLLLLSLPIVIYMANVETFNDISILMYICFNIVTVFFIVVFYRYLSKKYLDFLILPLIFLVSPVLFYEELSSMRFFIDIMSCPAGWEIIAIFPTLFYSLPFFIITCIVSLIIFNKNNQKMASIRE